MKIATYNVWNDESTTALRLEPLLAEIARVDADVIALQEVTSAFDQAARGRLPQYPYAVFRTYTDEDEGLSILSKYPLESCVFLHTQKEHCSSNALNVVFRAGNARFSLTNVHLPWQFIRTKEEQIIAIDRFIHSQHGQADYFLLLGDFNCGESSSVHCYLEGDQTLHGADAAPYWLDIADTYSVLSGVRFPPTLDCIGNPRWKGRNTIYAPENFDRIYILDNWTDFSFEKVQVFGTEADAVTKLCPSDHYGVAAEIRFGSAE